jgi:hypothetical protein
MAEIVLTDHPVVLEYVRSRVSARHAELKGKPSASLTAMARRARAYLEEEGEGLLEEAVAASGGQAAPPVLSVLALSLASASAREPFAFAGVTFGDVPE